MSVTGFKGTAVFLGTFNYFGNTRIKNIAFGRFVLKKISSLLPGDDRWGYEKASERWLPVHTVETILVSVISMLADPNDE